MSLDNRVLASDLRLSKPNLRYTPTPITLDLRLDERIARVERKGHLSIKLAYCKKELEPAEEPLHIQQLKKINKLRENKRLSLQVLPKLNDYELPINQMSERQLSDTEQKSPKKIPFLKQNNHKFKRIVLNQEEEFEKIEKILFKVIEQENPVELKIQQDLQKHLTHPLPKRGMYSRRVVNREERAGERLNYQYRQLQPNCLYNRIRDRLSSKDSIERNQKSPSILRYQSRRKKDVEYNGWEVQRVFDCEDF